MYAPGSPLAVEEAKKQLQAFPDFIEIAGGEQQAMDYLMNLNQQTAMANAQKVNYGLVGDREYIDAETAARLQASGDNSNLTGLNPWLSTGDFNRQPTNNITTEISERMFDKEGNLSNEVIVEEVPREGLSVASFKGDSFLTTERKKPISGRSKYGKTIDEFKTKYSLPKELKDKEVYNIIQDVEKKVTQSFGTVWTIPESKDFSMRPLTQNTFVNDKGEFGDFKRRRVWVNGKELTGDDKVKELGDALGVNKEKLKESLSSIGTANMTFTGNSPASLIGETVDNKGRSVTIEVSNYDQIADAGKDVYNITNNFRTNNDKEFKLNHPPLFKDSNDKIVKGDVAKTLIKVIPVENEDGTTSYQAMPVVEIYNSDMGTKTPLTVTTDLNIFGEQARNKILPYIQLKN